MADEKRTIPEISVDARLMLERIRKMGTGEVVSDAEFGELIGRDLMNGGYGPFMTARNRALRDYGIVLGRVRKTGYRRLSDAEIVSTGQATVDRVRRSARRAFVRMTCAEYDKLSDESKVQHNTYASVFAALVSVTKASAVKRIEKQVEKAQKELPLAATLEAFKE